MNCPSCNEPVGAGAGTCPQCQGDLTEVVVGADGPPSPEPKSARPPWLVFGAVAVAVLALGAATWAMVGGDRPVGAQFADRFPSDAVSYVEIDMARLTSDDSKALAEAFAPIVEANTDEEFDLDALVDKAIDSFDASLADVDISFREDIGSWASGPIGLAVFAGGEETSERVAMVVGGRDADALDAFLAKLEGQAGTEVGGVEFITIDAGGESVLVARHGSDLLVVSDAELAAAMVAPDGGDTLADVEDFNRQLAGLPGDAAVVFAVDADAITETLGDVESQFGMMGLGSLGGAGNFGSGWTAGAVSIHTDSVRVDYVATPTEDTPLPSSDDTLPTVLPAETIAFFRVGMAIDQLATVAESGLLGGMEDELGVTLDQILAVFSVDGALAVWPSTDPELPVNAALVGLSDESQSAFVDQLAELSESMGLTATPIESGYLFEGLVGLGTRDTLTFLTTDQDLISAGPDESFADGELYARASQLVDGDLQLALDIPAVIDLVDGFIAADDPEAAQTLRCLPLGVAAAATEVDDDTIRSSFVLEVARPDGC